MLLYSEIREENPMISLKVELTALTSSHYSQLSCLDLGKYNTIKVRNNN